MLAIDKNMSFKKAYQKKYLEIHGEELSDGSNYKKYEALGGLVRDYVAESWMKTNKRYNETGEKQVYYFSMEFLLGRLLGDALLNLGIRDVCKEALAELGIDLEELENLEHDQRSWKWRSWKISSLFFRFYGIFKYSRTWLWNKI